VVNAGLYLVLVDQLKFRLLIVALAIQLTKVASLTHPIRNVIGVLLTTINTLTWTRFPITPCAEVKQVTDTVYLTRPSKSSVLLLPLQTNQVRLLAQPRQILLRVGRLR